MDKWDIFSAPMNNLHTIAFMSVVASMKHRPETNSNSNFDSDSSGTINFLSSIYWEILHVK